MKKVSVVVACYNASYYLEKCVDHLLAQTIGLENMEIILVDDASVDDGATLDIIMKYEREFPDVVMAIPLEENMKQGGARNVGVFYAGGEYLMFCDADDWLMPEALEHLHDAAKEQDADVVECRIMDVTDHRIEIDDIETGPDSVLLELDTEKKRKEFLITVNGKLSLGSQKKLYRLSLLKDHEIRFAEHLIFEEPSFVVPVRLAEKRHYFLDEALYICFLSPDSSMRGEWGTHKWDNRKVWIILLENLKQNGLFEKYYAEIEYLYMISCLKTTLRTWGQKGYTVTVQEMQEQVDTVKHYFPHASENQYLVGQGKWEEFLATVVRIEITEESMAVVNQMLRKFVCVEQKRRNR